MTVRFHIDPATKQPHTYGHDVTEQEVEAFWRHPWRIDPVVTDQGSALGQSEPGRYLRVIYVPDPTAGSVFVLRTRSSKT